jgi:hypothetical protein
MRARRARRVAAQLGDERIVMATSGAVGVTSRSRVLPQHRRETTFDLDPAISWACVAHDSDAPDSAVIDASRSGALDPFRQGRSHRRMTNHQPDVCAR